MKSQLILAAAGLFLSAKAQAFVASPPYDPHEVTVTECGNPVPYQPLTLPLPKEIGGRLAFYLAEYDAAGNAISAYGVGNPNEVHPIASAYKGFLVEAVMREVDAGRFSLGQKLTTTAANRSIEKYPAGTNSLKTLASLAIKRSDNTASDILQLLYGPEKFTRFLYGRSKCSVALLTTKAFWAAQAGLLKNVIGPSVIEGTLRYGLLPFEDRVKQANKIIKESQKLTGPKIQEDLELWFRGTQYTPQVDLNVQPTSTAKALADLAAATYAGQNLTTTRKVYRDIMATGCCRPREPKLKTNYWAAKGGSGWRILTLTGYVELPNGRRFAYAYLNDLTIVLDDPDLEKQIRPVVKWIEENIIHILKVSEIYPKRDEIGDFYHLVVLRG